MAGRLLVIDGDKALAYKLRQHFEEAGYEVAVATTSPEGVSLATEFRPNLILLALQMPEGSGLELFRRLRDTARTAHIPVMVLAESDQADMQKTVLQEGVYDVIEKPVDLDILALRVRNALRRAEREGLTEARTGLPTGRLIDERLARLEDETGWYRIDLEITEFGVFRDLYGFVTANEALRFAGNLVEQVVNEHGSPDDFVGHPTGTESFLIITSRSRGLTLRDHLVRRVSEELKSFYNFMEREQGYVTVEDGSGEQVQKPLMSAKVTVTQGDQDPDSYADDVWVEAADEDSTDDPPPDQSSGSTFEW